MFAINVFTSALYELEEPGKPSVILLQLGRVPNSAYMPGYDHKKGMQSAFQHRDREGRDAGRFHVAVERFMVGAEPFVVRSVSRLPRVVEGDHKTGSIL